MDKNLKKGRPELGNIRFTRVGQAMNIVEQSQVSVTFDFWGFATLRLTQPRDHLGQLD